MGCRSEKVLKGNGYYVTIVGDAESKLTVGKAVNRTFSSINRSFWGAVGYQKYDFVLCDPSSYLDEITVLIESGKLDIMMDKESPFKFENYDAMFEKSMARKAKGKLILHVSDDNGVNDEQKDDFKEEDQNQDKNENEEMYKINKRPKDDQSDNEEEEEPKKTALEKKEALFNSANKNKEKDDKDDAVVEKDNAQ